MEPVRIRNKRTNKFYTAQKSVANLVNSGVPLTDLEIETAPSADPNHPQEGRFLLVRASAQKVAHYLPTNYQVTNDYEDGTCLVFGADHKGWTLDGYVAPRLMSGLIASKELSTEEVIEHGIKNGLGVELPIH